MTVPNVIGVYPVPESPEPCYLIEMVVPEEGVDLAAITQEVPGAPPENWQVPYDEHFLNDGRVAFFFHYLDLQRPLETSYGSLALPAPSERPDRLRGIRYDPPG